MSNARKLVLKLLTRVEGSSSYSNILLDDALAKSKLDERDKKFASALFYGVLERKITLDAVIRNYSKRPTEKLNIDVRNILRMGVYQILYLDSVPDSAAVDESVELAKKCKNPSASGFVNGLLRNFIRADKKMPQFTDKGEKLSVEYSCPLWLVNKWNSEYGEEVLTAMLETSFGKPPVTVKANTLYHSIDEIISVLKEDGFESEINLYAKDALNIIGGGTIENTRAYAEGLVHVQDLSSQLCCKAVDPKENETVLDICAAPGGKTFTMAELMNNKGRIFAFDLHESRTKLIQKGAKRLDLSIVSASVNNGKDYNAKMPLADKVLCDVPCSGLGVIRRKPEIKYKNPKEFERLPSIQYEILNTSARYVKDGGILVYSTCTLSRAENDNVADKFLLEHHDFQPCPLGNNFPNGYSDYKMTITPDKYNSDGFFIAKFIKTR
ncbi:MAG: 16S rRNA (cytosine(967)-C(5))-methyltransferase RsmB [Oscillospiraceae bacterium]